MGSSRDVGRHAEQSALEFLQAEGLRLVVRNYRCKRGEIDLIMNDGGTLVFVEVRYRRSNRFGSAAETVDHSKQARIVTAARDYLQRYPVDRPCRFDVVAVTPDDGPEWIPDAFETH